MELLNERQWAIGQTKIDQNDPEPEPSHHGKGLLSARHSEYVPVVVENIAGLVEDFRIVVNEENHLVYLSA
jgi:hypothetical protein